MVSVSGRCCTCPDIVGRSSITGGVLDNAHPNLTIKSAEPWLKQQKKQGWFVTASETVNKPAIQQTTRCNMPLHYCCLNGGGRASSQGLHDVQEATETTTPFSPQYVIVVPAITCLPIVLLKVLGLPLQASSSSAALGSAERCA